MFIIICNLNSELFVLVFSQENASGVLSIIPCLSVPGAAYSVMTVWLNTSLPGGEPA